MAREGRRRGRLSRSGDFDRVFREGSSHANRYIVLYAFAREDSDAAGSSEARLGISVGRKVGGAVERNRVKRALREAFRGLPEGALPPRHDFVLVARADAGALVEREGTAGTQRALAELMEEAAISKGEG